MESLYFVSRSQFHQLVTHISLYRENASPEFQSLAEESLSSVGLNPHCYRFWNVPYMAAFFNKAVPLDVHGLDVFVDECAVGAAARSHGVLRYAFLAAAVRAREGGRWWYDFSTMNFVLAVGCCTGLFSLYVARHRFAWMRRRPFGGIALCSVLGTSSSILDRQVFPLFCIGVSRAQKCDRKALEKLECADCFNDVFQYTEQHKADLCSKKFIPSQPGFATVPDSVAKQLAKRVELQQSVLDFTMEEIRCAKGKLANRLCDVHRSLRTDGTFDAIRSPIQPINAQLAKESVGST
ncbi:hypothetical protein ERJ75_001098600 [Trypanosoma vivax]|nr:hypothetical protein ERJ75_001098600 [Trypanosoma vivax]